MAPRGRRNEAAEPQAYHQLGVRGRKTGVALPDHGVRDEHGMQPLANLFSSPRKSVAASANGEDDSGSEDMEIASSAGPGPRTVLKAQRNMQLPLPRSRSPLKTNLKSPARKNPHLDRLSSPTRGSIVEDRDSTVTRRLDFTSGLRGSARKPTAAARGAKSNGLNGGLSRFEVPEEEEEDEDPDIAEEMEQSMQMLNAMEEPEAEYDDEEEDEPLVRKAASEKRARNKPKSKPTPRAAAPPAPVREPSEELPPAYDDDDDSGPEPFYEEDVEEDEPVVESPPVRQPARATTRSPAAAKSRANQAASKASNKRRALPSSNSGRDDEDEDDGRQDDVSEPSPRQAKRQKTSAAPAAAAAKPKRGRPPLRNGSTKAEGKKPRGRPKGKTRALLEEDGEVGETSFAALQRGPPMPKSRGLVSVRRDADQLTQTRSGRHSYRPIEFWRGEEVVVGEEERDDKFNRHQGFVLPTIKEIIRVPHDTLPSKRAPRSQTRKKTKSKAQAEVVEEDEQLEDWEINPGTVAGEVVMWEPEHELQPPAEDEPVNIIEEQVAISADAVQTRDIRDATFRFAKTLTMPFMGAGVVDLPPGAEKRPKNSRKMHMVFFVHYGKVMVTINETQFRISAGGTWFVPRGNYYSISNDYDNPARIFFSQGCEVLVQPGDLAEE